MKIKCPNDATHNEFHVTVRVAQDWLVDEGGHFLECTDECSQIYSGPQSDSYYECALCGEVAEVVS